MSYKPDESTLIAWMYGELDEKEAERLENYFSQNPEEHKRMLELANVKSLLRGVSDKEVIAPPVFVDDNVTSHRILQSPAFRWISGIAAGVVFVLICARILGVEVVMANGEMRISMGRQTVAPPVQTASLTPEQVQAMINSTVVQNNEFIASQWADNQKTMNESIRKGLDQNSRKVEGMVRNASLASQEQVRQFVDGLQSENLQSIKGYLQLSGEEQKKYVETLLVDFSKYLQEQRNQDMNMFQTRMNSMESNTNQFKQETEQILSSIISNSGNRQKSY